MPIIYSPKILSHVKIVLLIYGLPGSGKTTLSRHIQCLMPTTSVLWFNADKVRSTLSKDLGFKAEDRIEQARRMGCLASLALDASDDVRIAMVDFVNPNNETYAMFQNNLNRPDGTPRMTDTHRVPESVVDSVSYPMFSVWMNTIKPEDSRFRDTSKLFESQRAADHVVDRYLSTSEEFDVEAQTILKRIVHGD
jgi:energy-coupling factor transporter ATP-binding protein EcfA2